MPMAKILVLDNSPALLDVFSMIIKINGHEPVIAQSVGELKTKVAEQNPDLLIIDVRLNAFNGKDLCKQIKSNPDTKHIPVLLASASPELLEDYEDCEADDILEKPFELSTVVNKMEKLLKKTFTDNAASHTISNANH